VKNLLHLVIAFVVSLFLGLIGAVLFLRGGITVSGGDVIADTSIFMFILGGVLIFLGIIGALSALAIAVILGVEELIGRAAGRSGG
jgi:hypothetical protein